MPFEKTLNIFFPEAHTISDHNRPLVRKLVVILFVAVMIPTTAAILTLYFLFSSTYKENVNIHLAESVQLHRRSIDDFLQRNEAADAADMLKRIHLAASDRVYIFDRNNRLLTSSADGSAEMSVAVPIAELWQSTVGSTAGLLRTKDSAGRDTIFNAVTVNSGQWLLVAARPATDAYGQLVRMYTTAVVTVIAGAVVMFVLALVLSVWLVGRLSGKEGQAGVQSHTMVETDKLSSIGELATGVAHEINNPVAVMIEEAGWVGDLLEDQDVEDTKNREEIRRALEQIKIHGKRCKEITSKLLSFAKKTAATVEDVQLNELLEELVAVSSQSAENIDVNIRTRFEDPLPIIRANYPELQQIFLNIINNALDAMEDRGGQLDLATRRDKDFVEVTVSDNGVGIAGPDLHRIFDPFFSTKPVGQGTGLGLSICYGFVNQMGGRIEVESELDVGSTFRIYLPIAK